MTIQEVMQLVAKGESETLEFKASTGQLKSAFETLCAFLNHEGGAVLFGVKDDGRIVGQEVTDQTRLDIANMVAKIEPSVQMNIDTILVEKNRYIIKLTVSPVPSSAPYVFSSKPFWRLGASTRLMPQQHYENLLLARVNIARPWEAEIVLDSSIEDLDHEEIYASVSDGVNAGRLPVSALNESIENILLRFHLIHKKQLKNAALVLFAKDHACLSQCHLKMARFQGKDKLSGFIDNQQLSGNVFKLLKAEDDFLRHHLSIAGTFKPDQLKRIDRPALPVLAVREALVNALCHRDYTDTSTSFSLGIFDDRLEIWNSGMLMKNLTMSILKQTHESVRRNKLISDIFYMRGFVERWGTGTNKMIALCQQNGLPEPEFEEHTGGFSVVLKFRMPMSASFSDTSANMRLSDRQKLIVHIFQQYGEMNTQVLLSKLAQSISQRTLQKELRFLKEHNILTSSGASRKTLWGLKEE